MATQVNGARVGVVGVGYWGSKHVRVLRATTGVVSVVGIDKRFAGTSAMPDSLDLVGYSDIEDALPHVDAVVIATPPSSHAQLGMQAIAAGKHVLIEKPMATTTPAARALIEAAESAGLVLMPGHTLEHNAAVHKLRDLVAKGELGQLFFLDCARLNLGLYQRDVGAILDLAPHDISIVNFILGSRPASVTAWGSRHVHPSHEDLALLRLNYPDLGMHATIHVSWLHPEKVRRVTAVGSRKMAVYDDMAAEERIRIYDKSAVPPEADDGPLSQIAYHIGGMVSPHVPFAEPLAVQDQHFIDCVTQGIRPSTDGASGLTVVQVLECALISVREKRTVALAEVERDLSAAE